MRILHLDTGREMRGGQWQALRLMEGLRRAGVEGTLLAPAGAPLLGTARGLGLDAQPLGPRAVMRLARQADLIHAHDAHAHTLAAVLGRAPLVVSRRVAFPIRSRWKYRRASRYAAVSEFVKRVLIEGGVPEEQIAVIYDGVPLREPAGGGDALVAHASADPLKGTELAVEAARLAGVPLQLARDLEAGLAGAGLFLYLTRSEGLGSAVLMAMAAAVPVIASNTGGLPEIIRHMENGWLTGNEPEAVAGAIRTLREDRALARRLADRGRETVAQKFSLDRMIDHTMLLYRQVLAC